MSKKNLNADGLLNELKGNSSFFPERKHEPIQQEQASLSSPLPTHITEQKKETNTHNTTVSRDHDTMTPVTHDTMIPRIEEDEVIEVVRKAVKQIGKEGATQRLTSEEKQAVADIEYRYQRQGIRTSGNEIIRIALNYAVEEYRKNGEKSILAKVLQRLNS